MGRTPSRGLIGAVENPRNRNSFQSARRFKVIGKSLSLLPCRPPARIEAIILHSLK